MFIPFASPPLGFLFFRHCETRVALWQSGQTNPVIARGCKTSWQSFEWCRAVTRLPRHVVPRSDEYGTRLVMTKIRGRDDKK